MGRDAVIVEDLRADPAAWSLGLRALDLAGVVDVVPAATTVLVRCASGTELQRVLAVLDDVEALEVARGAERPIEIPVQYDGADLANVADAVGCSTTEVVALHSSATYEVAFCGFAPGFGYLRGLPAELHLARRANPRTEVPAGSVAIAAEFSAVYPRTSPGGWHLIGTTGLRMFDAEREQPALLAPGTTVRFVPS